MKKIIFSILIAATATTAFAQTTQKLSATKVNEYGLIYTLPKTVIDITVETQKTVHTPGEFFRYAKKYLGMDPITEPSQHYTLKSIIANPRGVADSTERYLVQFKAGSTPYILVNDNNFPLTINSENVNEPEVPTLPEAVDAEPTILESPAASQAITAEMLQSTSSAKRAELAAARIFELRQSRSEIISGSAENMPADGQAMKLVLDNLAAQEAALTAMFVGTTQTSIQVASFTITPPDDVTTQWDCVIARLSTLDGIVDADDLTGAPIRLSLKVTARGHLPKNEKGEIKRFPKGGVAYRIPGTAEITVTYDGTKQSSLTTDVAQYGMVFGLDPKLFTDKKAPAYVIFNPTTGAITEIGTVTE